MGSLFSSSKKEKEATTVDENNKSDTTSPAQEKPKPANARKLRCAGCEKYVENEQDLYPYLNQNYCQVCMKAIKDNNRRTVNNIKRQSVAFSSAQVKEAVSVPQDTSSQSNTTQTENTSSASTNTTEQPKQEAPKAEPEHKVHETRERGESDKYEEVNLADGKAQN